MMESISRKGRASGLALLALILCAAAAPSNEPAGPGDTPESIIMRWPPRTRSTARVLLEKYGGPDQFDRDTLVWFNNGAWKRTIVHRKVVRRDPAGMNKGFLEQTIGYLVPNDKVADLKRFSPSIDVSQTAGELTFASESEAKNRLALNLADEIVTGKRSVADARAFLLKTSRLSASGKSSPYLDALLFDADNTRYMAPTGADR